MPDQSPITEFIILAHITKPRGFKGEVCITIDTDFPERLKSLKNAWLLDSDLLPVRQIRISRIFAAGNHWALKIKEINSAEEAHALVGHAVGIPREKLQQLPTDTYYWCDLVGCEVRDTSGTFLGTVTDILRLAVHDILVVNSVSNSEVLIPFIEQFIKEVVIDSKRITIDPIDGMFSSSEPDDAH